MASIPSLNVNLSYTSSLHEQDGLPENNSGTPLDMMRSQNIIPPMSHSPRYTANMMSAAMSRQSSTAESGDAENKMPRIISRPISSKQLGAEIKGIGTDLKMVHEKMEKVRLDHLAGNNALSDGQYTAINDLFEAYSNEMNDYILTHSYPVKVHKASRNFFEKAKREIGQEKVLADYAEECTQGIEGYQKRLAGEDDEVKKMACYDHLFKFSQIALERLVLAFGTNSEYPQKIGDLIAEISERMLQIEVPRDITNLAQQVQFQDRATELFGQSAVEWRARSFVMASSVSKKSLDWEEDWSRVFHDDKLTQELLETLKKSYASVPEEMDVEKFNQHTKNVREKYGDFFKNNKSYVESGDSSAVFKKIYDSLKTVLVKSKQKENEVSFLEIWASTRASLKTTSVGKADISPEDFDKIFSLFEHEFEFYFSQCRPVLTADQVDAYFSNLVDSEREKPLTAEEVEERELAEAVEHSLDL